MKQLQIGNFTTEGFLANVAGFYRFIESIGELSVLKVNLPCCNQLYDNQCAAFILACESLLITYLSGNVKLRFIHFVKNIR